MTDRTLGQTFNQIAPYIDGDTILVLAQHEFLPPESRPDQWTNVPDYLREDKPRYQRGLMSAFTTSQRLTVARAGARGTPSYSQDSIVCQCWTTHAEATEDVDPTRGDLVASRPTVDLIPADIADPALNAFSTALLNTFLEHAHYVSDEQKTAETAMNGRLCRTHRFMVDKNIRDITNELWRTEGLRSMRVEVVSESVFALPKCRSRGWYSSYGLESYHYQQDSRREKLSLPELCTWGDCGDLLSVRGRIDTAQKERQKLQRDLRDGNIKLTIFPTITRLQRPNDRREVFDYSIEGCPLFVDEECARKYSLEPDSAGEWLDEFAREAQESAWSRVSFGGRMYEREKDFRRSVMDSVHNWIGSIKNAGPHATQARFAGVSIECSGQSLEKSRGKKRKDGYVLA